MSDNLGWNQKNNNNLNNNSTEGEGKEQSDLEINYFMKGKENEDEVSLIEEFEYNNDSNISDYSPEVEIENDFQTQANSNNYPLEEEEQIPFEESNNKNYNRKVYKKRRFFPLLKKIIKCFFYLWIVGVIGLIGIFVYYYQEIPSIDDIHNSINAQSTKIFDRENNLLYEIHGEERRTIVSLSEVSPFVSRAVMAAEDDGFYTHFGIDIKGIIRSALANIITLDLKQGASTITQQLIKNSLLTSEKKWSRKIKEQILAVLLEQKYSKDEIMEMYLNTVAFGSNAYGIEAAAKTFFGKGARELDLAESATLAAVLRGTTYYSPYGNNRDDLLMRRDYILKRMYLLGWINFEQWSEAKNRDLEVIPYRENIVYPHWVMYIKEKLTEKYGEELLKKGGLRVYTSIDPTYQQLAQQSIDSYLEIIAEKYQASNAALVALNPKTGEILAMIGSRDYFNSDIEGEVNVALSLRQPGSSFKPFAYLGAFMKGYNPSTPVFDVKTNFSLGFQEYEPGNYDEKFRWLTNFRNSLAQSLNIPAVKALFVAGVSDVIDLVHILGITSLNRGAGYYGLSLVLGGGEVTLLDMVTAYSVFAENGVKKDLVDITKIVDSNGVVLFEADLEQEGVQVVDAGYIYLLNNILSDNKARIPAFGVNNKLSIEGKTVATKTGTTNGYHDGWTIGYTPSLVVGVWVGNNDNSPMKWGASGSLTAAPIWHSFMQASLQNKEDEPFVKPDNIVEAKVSLLSGKLPSEDTPEKYIISDIFVKDNLPTEKDNFLISKKVENITFQLANEYCPPESVENWVYENIHSLRSDLPNWEKPVREWAQNNSIVTELDSNARLVSFVELPTTESAWCTPANRQNRPLVQIISPDNLQAVPNILNRKIKVDLNIPNLNNIKKVEYYFDDKKIKELYKKPFNALLLTPKDLEDNSTHILKVKAYNEYSYSGEASVTLSFVPDIFPPVINLESPKKDKKIKVSRGENIIIKAAATDNEGEIERIEIYFNGQFLETVDDDSIIEYKLAIPENADIGQNKITIRAVDDSGNSQKEVIRIVVK